MATLPTPGADTDTWGTELNDYLLTVPNRQAARAASTANVTLPPGGTSLTIDGVTLANAERVLLKNQTTPAQNGIYDVGGVGSSVTLTRSFDADAAAKLPIGMRVPIREGTVGYDTVWRLATTAAITLNTTALYFTQEYPTLELGTGRNPWMGAESGVTTIQENLPWQNVVLNTIAVTSGALRVAGALVARAGTTYSRMMVITGGTAATALTDSWGCLIRLSDLQVMAVSPDDTTAWAANTLRTFVFGTPWTPVEDTPVYVGLNVTATTPPTFLGSTLHVSPFGVRRAGNSTTGLTTPLTVGATAGAVSSGQSAVFYAALR